MKISYRVLSISGALIWAGTVLLRGTTLMDNEIAKQILWRTPNFGAVWLSIGLFMVLYSHFLKKDFNEKYIYALIGAVLACLLLSEILHVFTSNTSFDIWDMVASILAASIIAVIHLCKNIVQRNKIK